MFRFTMPPSECDSKTRRELLLKQFDEFLNAKALKEICSILHVDQASLRQRFDGRSGTDGRIKETQELGANVLLEKHKIELFPFFDELGFIGINKPLIDHPDHLLILGGSQNACFDRVYAGKKHITENTKSFDGLSCYRPLNPIEQKDSAYHSNYETEFGVMSEAIASAFGLSMNQCDDLFKGDRNLHKISCVRTIKGPSKAIDYRVFAAPSSEPELRRADTTDSFVFYLENTIMVPHASVLAVTNNRYCNRQFLQLAYPVIHHNYAIDLDVVGCSPDQELIETESYDPFQLMQDLIGILDWIDRFKA